MSLVDDERVETLVRALVDHFAAIGGVPLLAVFDRPKTVALKWRRDGVVTEWNPTFAGVALDLGLGVEVCWPYSPRAEGLGRESGRLGEGLVLQAAPLPRRGGPRSASSPSGIAEVNTQRPSRATGVIAGRAHRARSGARLRPLKVAPAELALRIPVMRRPDRRW